ncbi:transposase [Ralstonia solanacearum]|nr:transposase [Ralstonia solanacearum]
MGRQHEPEGRGGRRQAGDRQRGRRHARGLERQAHGPYRPGRTLDQEARQELLRLQAARQTWMPATSWCASSRSAPPMPTMARHLADVLDPSNTRSRVLADRGYDSGANRNVLEEHHLKGGIARRTLAGKEPGARLKARNRAISRTRAWVEHVFAGLHQLGGKTVRAHAGAQYVGHHA